MVVCPVVARSRPSRMRRLDDLPAPFGPTKPVTRPGQLPVAYQRMSGDELHGRHHYLDICFRCRKLLSGNRDIFMYR